MWKTNFDQLSPNDVLSAKQGGQEPSLVQLPTVEDIPPRKKKGKANTTPINVSH